MLCCRIVIGPDGNPAMIGSTSCTSCAAGTYSAVPGASSCNGTCDPGTYSTLTGATSSQCPNVCSPGSYSLAGASSCSLCDAGTYKSMAGAGNCSFCDTGTYSSKNGSSCLECGPGSVPSSCLSAGLRTVTYKGKLYAALDGTDPNSWFLGSQTGELSMPSGWEVAPDDGESTLVIGGHPWGTSVMVVADGKMHGSQRWSISGK